MRSGVAKNALLGFTDLFGGVGHSVERYLDSMVPLLVKKAADKLRILADAADAALLAMVENCGERQCLQALLCCTAKGMNNDVRNKCGRHLARLLCKLPGHRITSQPQINDIIRAVARQLSEGSEEPRMAAKFILAHVRCGRGVCACAVPCRGRLGALPHVRTARPQVSRVTRACVCDLVPSLAPSRALSSLAAAQGGYPKRRHPSLLVPP